MSGDLSLDGLDCYLSLNYVPCPWTLVEGIEKLPPGQWLEWRDGEVSSQPYWRCRSERLVIGRSNPLGKNWTLFFGNRSAST